MAGKKSGSFNKEGIDGLAKDKPVVYNIENKNGKTLYTGVAKKGRVEDRLKEHLPSGQDPVRGGAKVKIQQKSSIDEALKSEARIIKSQKPPQNKKGK
ncbi:MAG TPA: GIY-YIG nuclease family protein [Nitrospinota bacterium]|jgi:predicted GIY-YIG superfamily endonuclease|nr:GIY-YIG nuclease family protein [Nitrospinota bacterium]|tara:strand:- start:2575 stop:2868 length:294 start_codon:yes stop_codon:yes gene_type:complete